MTHEIQRWQERLREILAKEKEGEPAERRTAIHRDLQELAFEVGAWTRTVTPAGTAVAGVDELTRNIHQALQTLSMIDACKTAADTAGLTEDALQETRKAQRTSRIIAIAAMASALAAIGSMVAAWMAAMKT
jgi:hypothetical protein